MYKMTEDKLDIIYGGSSGSSKVPGKQGFVDSTSAKCPSCGRICLHYKINNEWRCSKCNAVNPNIKK